MRPLRLGFAGDVMLGRTVDERQRRGGRPPHAVWGSVYDDLRELDGFFVNLECCLSTRGRRWQPTSHPYHFRATPDWALPALTRAGVSWVSLANNHALDFGTDALLDTFDALETAGIPYAGAGRDVASAWEPAVVDIGGSVESVESVESVDSGGVPPESETGPFRVAVVALTDNEPTFAATEDDPGTAHFDVRNDGDRSRVEAALAVATATKPNLLIVSLHWGPNMVERPPRAFREFAHWLVDRGVDLVYGHSAHVFQGVEVYDGTPILYDTGDFVDDYAVDSRLRNDRGFRFEFDVVDGAPATLRLRPIELHDCAVHRADAHVAAWCRDRMRRRSASLGTSFVRDGDGLRVNLSA